MRMMKWGAVVVAVLVAGAGVARARTEAKFAFDGRIGLVVPAAGVQYADTFYPSPAFGVDLGAEIRVRPRLRIAPEFVLDLGPLLGRHSTGITTGRVRFVPGLRVLVDINARGDAVFGELLVGGELFVYGPGGRQGSGTVNAGFATQPGGGMQFRISSRGVAGFVVGVPVGVHTFASMSTAATSVDVNVTGFVGGRW